MRRFDRGWEGTMQPCTTQDVQDLLLGFVDSAALGAALETGLFWRLAEQPQRAAEVAHALDIPPRRCRYWLDLLVRTGLLAREGEVYVPSDTARAAILGAYSHATWAQLALEFRERLPAVLDLAVHIHEPGSVWAAQEREPPDYFAQIVASPERARNFTRMLGEAHLDLADELAATLDLAGVQRMLDLGGGSGVMSLALLRRHPQLTAVVVDVETVCAAGREIAAGYPEADRIVYHAANYLRDELPGGMDLVLMCDVGAFDEVTLGKLRTSLNPGGRLVVVDQFAPAEGVAPEGPQYLHWSFLGSLENPSGGWRTVAWIRERLAQAGFRYVSERTLSDGWVLMELRT
jgi:SAM-dependent methyltransferase